MFDLFRRKDKNLRILLGVLLGLVALSLVITLIPGFGGPGFGGMGEEKVATVCGEPVTAREVRLKVRQMLNRTELTADSAALFIPQFVDQLVSAKAMSCQATDLGLLPGDEDVAKSIQKDIPQLWQDGKFIGTAAYENVLRQGGITVREFEESIRQDIASTRLRTLVAMSSIVTPAEIEAAFHELEDGLQLEYVAIDPAEIGKKSIPSDAEVRAYFAEKANELKSGEIRKVNLVVLDPMRFGATMQVSDEMARRYYNENIEDFRRPERAHVRHILFKTQEKPESEDAKMKALAEDVFKRIKAGASFAAMAKQYSEDPGSKDNGGEYPNITRGQTVKNFEDTSFNAPLKTLVGPIKTEFGYHLMEVLDRQPAQLLSFDQVAEQIKNEIKQQQGADALGRAADNLRRELEKTTEGLQELAAKAAGTVYTLEYKNAQYALPELGIKPELFNRIQTMKKGQVTDPQTLDNRMVLIQIADVLPPRPLTLEEARPQIVSILQNSATQKRVEEARKQADLMVVAGEKDLAKMARELGMPLKKTQLFSRRGFADGIGPAISVESGFSAPIGHVWGPFTVDGGWFVAKVIDKKTADLSQLPARRAEVINQVKSKKANERNDIIEDRLVQKLMDSGRVKINETAKRRLASTGI